MIVKETKNHDCHKVQSFDVVLYSLRVLCYEYVTPKQLRYLTAITHASVSIMGV